MQIDLGARVITQDGEEVGKVTHLVLNPSTTQLSSIVVEHGLLNREARMVPTSLIENATEEQVWLRGTKEHFEQLNDFIETDYTAPPPGIVLPLSYPGGGLLWPVGELAPTAPSSAPVAAMVDQEVSEKLLEQNLENAIIDRDSDVISRDGEKIGEVEQLAMDTVTGKPARLVISKGFLVPESLELPISSIASVDDGVVRLNLGKDEALRMAAPVRDT